jgi:hypothetical protein
LEAVLAKDGRQVTARRFLLNAYQMRAQCRAEVRQDADAVKDWDRALALGPGTRRDEFRVFRALSLARTGATARAIKELEALSQAPKLGAQFPGWAAYAAARAYAVSSGKAKEASEQSARHADRAIELLGRARQAGYFKEAVNVEALKKEPDFEPLRGRDDFRRLLSAPTADKN